MNMKKVAVETEVLQKMTDLLKNKKPFLETKLDDMAEC